MSEKITYTQAFEELQAIVEEIEKGQISVDELSEKVKRATFLIKLCKTRLTTTEEDVISALANFGVSRPSAEVAVTKARSASEGNDFDGLFRRALKLVRRGGDCAERATASDGQDRCRRAVASPRAAIA